LFWPLPERWAYPDSSAILLSDLWTTWLIKMIRPVSGLDNCFPSFHVSMTVLVVCTGFWFRFRHRYTVSVLGFGVIVSAFLIGIHWSADIIGGIGLGVISFLAGVQVDRWLQKRNQALQARVRAM
ncbi:MAG: phosphatase PAP2 family protein, partial [Planctomycetota bacterium]|nr:phosphatase PAP2 family protein [Planctomycetota bacterium]